MDPNNSVIKRLWCNLEKPKHNLVKYGICTKFGVGLLFSKEATFSQLVLPLSEKGSTLK